MVEAGYSVLFTSTTALLAALAKVETDGQLADRLMFYTKPRLLIIDELGYRRSSAAARICFSSWLRVVTNAPAC